jgi:hypothetical protein
MNGTTHPSAALLERYRRRAANAAETLDVDAHVASCDRCFDAVRADAHLTYDQLEALAGGSGETTAPHLALCDACRGELTDLRLMRAAIRQEQDAPRRWWLAAAAMLAIALSAGLLLLRGEPAGLKRPSILDTLITEHHELRRTASSGPFALYAPVATVVLDARPHFRWAAVAGAASYEVAVADLERGTVAASGTSASASWQPAAPLTRGRTYAWQVAAATTLGRIIAPGPKAPEARFHVATESTVAGTTPLERGVALARLGALDDAERELKSAGADDLLDEIHTWR